jgi:hypothetical protein
MCGGAPDLVGLDFSVASFEEGEVPWPSVRLDIPITSATRTVFEIDAAGWVERK